MLKSYFNAAFLNSVILEFFNLAKHNQYFITFNKTIILDLKIKVVEILGDIKNV